MSEAGSCHFPAYQGSQFLRHLLTLHHACPSCFRRPCPRQRFVRCRLHVSDQGVPCCGVLVLLLAGSRVHPTLPLRVAQHQVLPCVRTSMPGRRDMLRGQDGTFTAADRISSTQRLTSGREGSVRACVRGSGVRKSGRCLTLFSPLADLPCESRAQ